MIINNAKNFRLIFILAFLFFQFSYAFAQQWELDLKVAKKIARDTDRSIILVFSGSDWCAPCIKLERQIWNSEKFKAYAKKHYVMVRADFPKRKGNKLSPEQAQKNEVLAEKYNANGFFPFVVVMDKNATVLGNTGYKKLSPQEYIAHLNSFINN